MAPLGRAGHCHTPHALVPQGPPAWRQKAARDEAKLSPAPAWCHFMAGPRFPARVQLGPRSWKMLLGLYSTSGMFLKIEPDAEPRSDKMEPGTQPGLFFGFTTPKSNSQDTTHPIGWGWAASGPMLLRSTFGFTVCSSMVQLSLSWPFTSNRTDTCSVLLYLPSSPPLSLYFPLPLPFSIFSSLKNKLSK